MLAPIALFAYNRPDHLKETLNALMRCRSASETHLHVFSDAPSSSEEADRVADVRKILSGITGFAKVDIVAREANLGLGRSIIDGVTSLCRRYGRVIVLEDDLVVAPGFLRFMNDALDRYAEATDVMQVSGYMFPLALESIGDTFLCRMASSWGWATWERAWKHFDPDPNRSLRRLMDTSRQTEFDLDGAYPYLGHLEACARGELDVWGVRWYASMFFRNGLCLYPTESLVSNRGMDGSGVHCGRSTLYDVRLSQRASWHFPSQCDESRYARHCICQFLTESQGRTHRLPFTRSMATWGRLVYRPIQLMKALLAR